MAGRVESAVWRAVKRAKLTALHCTALHCTALHCTALLHNTLPERAAHYERHSMLAHGNPEG
jgi:hypothetical protein